MPYTATEWIDQPVIINANGIYIGDFKVPGVIAQDGITIKPDASGLNTMTVEFLVGTVIVEDSTS